MLTKNRGNCCTNPVHKQDNIWNSAHTSIFANMPSTKKLSTEETREIVDARGKESPEYRIWKEPGAIELKQAVEPKQAAETKTEQNDPKKAVERKQAAETNKKKKQGKLASFCTRSWKMCTTCKEIWIFCWGCKKAISKM